MRVCPPQQIFCKKSHTHTQTKLYFGGTALVFPNGCKDHELVLNVSVIDFGGISILHNILVSENIVYVKKKIIIIIARHLGPHFLGPHINDPERKLKYVYLIRHGPCTLWFCFCSIAIMWLSPFGMSVKMTSLPFVFRYPFLPPPPKTKNAEKVFLPPWAIPGLSEPLVFHVAVSGG